MFLRCFPTVKALEFLQEMEYIIKLAFIQKVPTSYTAEIPQETFAYGKLT